MKKVNLLKKVSAAALSAVLLISAAFPAFAESPETPEITTVNYTVTYHQSAARDSLRLVNNFRTSEKDAWYWNEDNQTKTEFNTGSNKTLSAFKYDYDLEKAAMQRAAELALSFSHTRPDGQAWSTALKEFQYTSYSTAGESIAVNSATDAESAMTQATAQWREDDKPYSGQGHRRSMLNASFTKIAIACVEYNGLYYCVQEFSARSKDGAVTAALDSEQQASVKISSSTAASAVIDPSALPAIQLEIGESAALPATVSATLVFGGNWPNGSAKTVQAVCN